MQAPTRLNVFIGLGCVIGLLSCNDSPTTAPPAVAERVGVPAEGPMSLHAPVGGSLSKSVPVANALSSSSPRAVPFAGSTASAVVAPAMRMLWQNTSTGDRSIWLMNGTSWNGSYAALPQVPTAWSIAGSGDFNADGNADIVWQNMTTGDRSIWFMNGTTWSGNYALLPQVSTQWSIAGVGDFNTDGKPDLVWQNTTTGDRSVWFMNGSTWNGGYALLPNVSTQWSIAAVGDFNGDGKPDLVWQNTTSGERSIWFMNGISWNGAYALLQTVPPAWRIAAAADFDGDGDLDLVWQNISTGERSIWLMNGSSWAGSYASLPTVSTQWAIAGMLFAEALPVGSVVVSPSTASFVIGATQQYSATLRDAYGNVLTGRNVTWTLVNPSASAVATINATGFVTGTTDGSITVRATSEAVIGDAALTVLPLPPDAYEPNDSRSTAYNLGTVSVSGAAYSVNATFNRRTDISDWYHIIASEDQSAICFPGSSQSFVFTVSLRNIPAGRDYDLYVYQGDRGASSTNGSNANELVNFNFSGTCGVDDSTPFDIDVLRYTGTPSSTPYNLTITFQRN
jgi:hypothetical protein